MSEPVGADRLKLIRENFRAALRDALVELEWLNEDGTPKPLGSSEKPVAPIIWATKRTPDHEPIPDNLLIAVFEDTDSQPGETGSSLTEDEIEGWIDFFPNDDDLGADVIADIVSLLQGKRPDVGFSEGGFTVFDLRPARLTDTPGAELFWIDIERVRTVHNAGNPATPELRFWRAVSFVLEDSSP